MTGVRAPLPVTSSTMGRRTFLGRTALAGAAVWAAPTVISMDPVAAAVGSCSGVSVCEFSSGLEGWTIDNSWGSGVNGLWNHNTEASRDGGSLHYGRGTNGNFRTGNNRNSGRVLSPEFEIPSTGPNTVKFTVWREVEKQDPGYDRLRLLILGSSTNTLYQVSSIGDTSGFESYTITIPSSFNGQTVRFQFDFDTRDGLYNDHEGIYVGRFEVTACPPAGADAGASPGLAPAGFSSFAPSSASLSTEADDPVPAR
ncbi:MAG: hypothetical protein R2707_12620 [Acidimicrobiales bacterium]